MALAGSAVLAALGAFWLHRQGRFERTLDPPRPLERSSAGAVETVYFESHGTRLEAWLFQPLEPTEWVVIMAHGLGGTKECLLESYAWQFVREGAAVLLFDFRTLGGSEGHPRHWIDPFRQIADYEAALDFARRRYKRVVLWGSSFSGGQALCVAGRRQSDVHAVIAHAPFLATPRHLEPTGWMFGGLAFMAALDTTLATLSRNRLPPVYIPAFGKPGEFAFARSEECPSRHNPNWHSAGPFWEALPTRLRGGWQNVLCARMLVRIKRFTPRDELERVECPVLLIGAERDTLIPREFLTSAAKHLRNAQLEWLDCAHFALYVSPFLEQSLELQSAFLRRVQQAGD